MIRLKELRESVSKTQAEVAAELNVSQQTYARWEKGKTKPSLQALRDISQLFDTTVDRLLGPQHVGAPVNHVRRMSGETGRLWGHFGLRLKNTHRTRWYPVDENQRSKLRQSLPTGYDVVGWLVTKTLDNRVLAFRPNAMQRMRFLDDAGGEPENDFDLASPFGYDILPYENYKAMAEWEDSENEGEETFFVNNSNKTQKDTLALIRRLGYKDRPGKLRQALRFTTLHFTDDDAVSYEADRSTLSDLFLYIEAGVELNNIELRERDGDLMDFCPWSSVCLIEFPLIELEAAWADLDA